MNDDHISYPTDEMSSTSRSLQSFIDDQWNQHSALFVNNPDSYLTLMQNVAGIFSSVYGKANEIPAGILNYHQEYQKCYNALHDLAKEIDRAAQTMSETDKNQVNRFHTK